MDIKEFAPVDHNIKALIYGPSKSGKTTFGGTAPSSIFASAEGGLLSIVEKNPHFVEIKSFKDLSDLYKFLLHEKHDYKTVIIDSITEINDIIKMEIERRTGKSMQVQDWGELAKKILDLLRKFRDLPMHVIFLALEKYITDEDKIRKVVPMLDGKAATGIAAFMDIVGYINIENDGTRWIETNSNKKLLTGDRSKVIGNDTSMDFSIWIQKVEERLSGKTGKRQVLNTYTSGLKENKPFERKQLLALQKELKFLGAKDKVEALKILNESLRTNFESLNFSEDEAGNLLVQLLQVKDSKTESPQVEKPVEERKTFSLDYTNIEKVKKIISSLNTRTEINGLLMEAVDAFKQGDITAATEKIIENSCIVRLKEIEEDPKRKTKKTTK